MKLYLTKHGYAVAELSLDELTDIQSALLLANNEYGTKRPGLYPIYTRISSLVNHWLESANQLGGASKAKAAQPNPGTQGMLPLVPHKLGHGSQQG